MCLNLDIVRGVTLLVNFKGQLKRLKRLDDIIRLSNLNLFAASPSFLSDRSLNSGFIA